MRLVMSVLLLAIACSSGCASAIADTAGQEPTSVLVVRNQCSHDAAIYVLHNGTKTRRLDGYVTGNSGRTFVLVQSDVAEGTLQLFAKYVGGGGVPSQPILAVPGSSYVWELQPECGDQEFLWRQRAE